MLPLDQTPVNVLRDIPPPRDIHFPKILIKRQENAGTNRHRHDRGDDILPMQKKDKRFVRAALGRDSFSLLLFFIIYLPDPQKHRQKKE